MMPAYKFGEFFFDADSLLLKKNEEEVALRHQPARLLKHLLETAPGIVSRGTLQDEIWDDGVNVEFDQSLNACVNQLRSVLGDKASDPKFVETLPKRGYRFCADFEKIATDSPSFDKRVIALASAVFLIVAVTTGNHFLRPVQSDPVVVYVAPVKVDFDVSADIDDLAQYALRIGAVEQLMRHDYRAIQAINGESLWGNFESTSKDPNRRYDYALHLSVHDDGDGYRLDAALIRNDNSAEYRTTSLNIKSLDADEFSIAAVSLATWAAGAFERKPQLKRPQDLAAYSTLYYSNMIKARRALRVASLSSLAESVQWFDAALEEAPESKDAMAGKALALSILAGRPGFATASTYQDAISIADDIEKNGILDARAQLVRGAIFLYRDWEIEAARKAFDHAFELAPGDALVHSWRAGILAAQGDVDGAVQSSGHAVSMDPLSMAVNSDHCWFLNAADQFADAVKFCRWALEIDPSHTLNRFNLAIALELSGESGDAVTALKPIIRSLNNSDELPSSLTDMTDATSQLRASYCYMADKLTSRVEEGTFPNYQFAAIMSKCGKYDDVPRYLEIAKQTGESGMLFYNVDPRLDEFRTLPEAENVGARIFIR